MQKKVALLLYCVYPGVIKPQFMTFRLLLQLRPAAPLRMEMSLCIAPQGMNAISSTPATRLKESPTGANASSSVEIQVS